jgi:hypothetical protein
VPFRPVGQAGIPSVQALDRTQHVTDSRYVLLNYAESNYFLASRVASVMNLRVAAVIRESFERMRTHETEVANASHRGPLR